MKLLYFLESLRTPALDLCMSALTAFGDETLFIVIALVIFWCISKQCGYYLFGVGFFSILINQFVKICLRIPRPWVRDPGFTIVESARAGAGGYSFPSGHTASASSLLGCCARWTKRRMLRIVFTLLILAVGVSRLYLGVHTPADVLFSLAVSAALIFSGWPLFRDEEKNARTLPVVFGSLTALSLAFVLGVTIHDFSALIDEENLLFTQKSTWLLTGGGVGILVGLSVEARCIRFDVRAPWWAQALKCALGLAIIFGIKEGLKALFGRIFGTALFPDAIRYGIIVIFASCVWPLTFRWFGAGCPLGKRN